MTARPARSASLHRRPAARLAFFAAVNGLASVISLFFQTAQHGAGHAMTVSVAVVGAIALLCLGLVWLLPKSAMRITMPTAKAAAACPIAAAGASAGRRRAW